MHPYLPSFLAAYSFLVSLTPALCESVQFVHSSGIGLALSTFQNGTGTDALFHLTAPTQAGWGSIGTGDRMDGSLMFILYPASNNEDVTVSIRTASGHDTPSPIYGNDVIVQSSSIRGQTMSADIIWYNCTAANGARSVDTTSANQPWIYALGPGEPIASDSQDAAINKHDEYGVFFTDLTKSQSNSSTVPQISGQVDINTTLLPSSVQVLVIIHAICLGGAFVLVFPLGVAALRWRGSFKIHWIVQLCATTASIIGGGIAIAFSLMDPEYKSFGEGHQVLGLVVVGALLLQAFFGYFHHLQYKKTKRRTWVSHLHLWVGRGLMVLGMINTVTGFILAHDSGVAIGVGILAAVILIGTTIIVLLGNRRQRAKTEKNLERTNGYLLDESDSQSRLATHVGYGRQ